MPTHQQRRENDANAKKNQDLQSGKVCHSDDRIVAVEQRGDVSRDERPDEHNEADSQDPAHSTAASRFRAARLWTGPPAA